MATVEPSPGLSALLAWPVEHLTEGADHWDAVAGQSYGVASQVWQDSLSVDWQGAAGDALRTATNADLMMTNPVVGRLQEAANIARSGASDLSAARSRLQYLVKDAREAGFDIGEDISVNDRYTDGSPALRAARQAEAEAFAADIGQRAAQLVGLDQEVAEKVTTAMAGVGTTTFRYSPGSGAPPKPKVQAVNRTWKQEPAPSPQPAAPKPPNAPSADDIRRVLDKLPVGDNPRVREVRSLEDLERLWRWLEQNGIEIPDGYGDPRKGIQYHLPDGTKVGRRAAANSTELPALDVRVPGGDGFFKVHINAGRGGVPEVPAAPRLAPPEPVPPGAHGEPPAAEPPTAPAPPKAAPTAPVAPAAPPAEPKPGVGPEPESGRSGATPPKLPFSGGGGSASRALLPGPYFIDPREGHHHGPLLPGIDPNLEP